MGPVDRKTGLPDPAWTLDNDCPGAGALARRGDSRGQRLHLADPAHERRIGARKPGLLHIPESSYRLQYPRCPRTHPQVILRYRAQLVRFKLKGQLVEIDNLQRDAELFAGPLLSGSLRGLLRRPVRYEDGPLWPVMAWVGAVLA